MEILAENQLTGTSEDGNSIFLERVKKMVTGDYVRDEMQNITRLDNIDTVIFCTGYEPNMDMFDKDDDSNKDLFYNETQKFELPRNWTMQEHLLTPWLGDIQPGDLNYDDYYVPPFYCLLKT